MNDVLYTYIAIITFGIVLGFGVAMGEYLFKLMIATVIKKYKESGNG